MSMSILLRLISIILVVCMIKCECVRIVRRPLTVVNGQEIIELDTSSEKDLPKNIDEEPSSETGDDKKAPNKTVKALKLIDVQFTRENLIEEINKSKLENDESEIEKAYYKDSSDYSMDSEEKPRKINLNSSSDADDEETKLKNDNRRNDRFGFQPETMKKDAIELYKTSIDDISCDRKMYSVEVSPRPGKNESNAIIMSKNILNLLLTIFMFFN